jgi:general secretion pathway protein G
MNMNKTRDSGMSSGGFTLIEIMLVVVILGILATVVLTNLSGRDKEARINATRTSISAICTAIETYELDNGSFPASMQSLVTSSGEPNWKGPYIRGGMSALQDPWGTPFTYTPKGDNDYVVTSAGPDRQMGSGDDITSFTN